ncbi:MAG: ATP-binding protein [Thermodesulfovibrionales bacterium]
MEDMTRLNEAFRDFTQVSRSLEGHYEKLRDTVRHLAIELEQKNRALEEALSSAEEAKDSLRCILESLGEAIIVLDQDRRVTMINRAAEEMLGTTAREAAGLSLEGIGFHIECSGGDPVLHAGGTRRNVFVSESHIRDSAGGLRGHVILLRDVTRLRELEAEGKRNQRLIAMGEMAAAIVHQVRSPLCSIELYASMLQRELEGTSHTALAAGISTGIRSLNNVLSNVLFFARPQKPELRGTDLSEVLGQAVLMLKPLVENRGLKLTMGLRPQVAVEADAELLKQVFLNVLLNAIQASGDGGRIEVSVTEDGDTAVVEIRDEAGGIPEDELERIFDPFWSTKDKGTGLGLAIASKIMQAHGGTIKVKSARGQGSCFAMFLPMRQSGAARPVQAGPAGREAGCAI